MIASATRPPTTATAALNPAVCMQSPGEEQSWAQSSVGASKTEIPVATARMSFVSDEMEAAEYAMSRSCIRPPPTNTFAKHYAPDRVPYEVRG